MLKPLMIYRQNPDGTLVLDGDGNPIPLPEHQQRPKTEAELSAGDRQMLINSRPFEDDWETRRGEQEIVRQARLDAAAALRKRESSNE